MAYSNKVARSRGTTINQNQGGGSKKAGFPYIVGRTQWSNIHFRCSPSVSSCCKLPGYNTTPANKLRVSPLAGLKFTRSMGVDHY
jgi:hypothetical protein